MIPGNPYKILLVDDSDSSDSAMLYLLRKGYDVGLTTVGSAMSTILTFWPDLIVLTTDGTSIEETCKASPYLNRKKVIHCYG